MSAISTARTWGSTGEERALAFPCDRHVAKPRDAYYRAIDVETPASVLFRWLCQLRAAPYSYDWIDNLGRRSPQELLPGLEQLEIGQSVMTIFELVEFEADRHLTLRLRRGRRLAGELAVTYLVIPVGADRCRLVVKLALAYPGGRVGAWLGSRLFPLPEVVMMRRQLLNLKRLAEAQAGPQRRGAQISSKAPGSGGSSQQAAIRPSRIRHRS